MDTFGSGGGGGGSGWGCLAGLSGRDGGWEGRSWGKAVRFWRRFCELRRGYFGTAEISEINAVVQDVGFVGFSWVGEAIKVTGQVAGRFSQG